MYVTRSSSCRTKTRTVKRWSNVFFLLASGIVLGVLIQDPCMTMQTKSHTLVISDNDSLQKVGIRKGDTLRVKLGVQMGTGYSWRAKNRCRILESLQESEVETSKGPLPGGVENQVFLFQAKKEGRCILTLVYQKPWERDGVPSRTFRLRVHIR